MRRTHANYSPETAAPAEADFPSDALLTREEDGSDDAPEPVQAAAPKRERVDHHPGRLSEAARPVRQRQKRRIAGRGRRTKRKRDDKRYRKESRALTWDEFVLLDDGYHLARSLGHPLE